MGAPGIHNTLALHNTGSPLAKPVLVVRNLANNRARNNHVHFNSSTAPGGCTKFCVRRSDTTGLLRVNSRSIGNATADSSLPHVALRHSGPHQINVKAAAPARTLSITKDVTTANTADSVHTRHSIIIKNMLHFPGRARHIAIVTTISNERGLGHTGYRITDGFTVHHHSFSPNDYITITHLRLPIKTHVINLSTGLDSLSSDRGYDIQLSHCAQAIKINSTESGVNTIVASKSNNRRMLISTITGIAVNINRITRILFTAPSKDYRPV